MCSRARTRPTCALPALHAHQLCRLVELDYTIDLSVRMLMVLAPVWFFAVHVDRGDGEVHCLIAWKRNFASTILLAIYWDGRAPPFVIIYSGANQTAEVFVECVARPIVFIEKCFCLMTGCSENSISQA